MFEDSSSNSDEYNYYGEVRSDIQFLLNLPEFVPKSSCFKAPTKANGGMIILFGEYGKDKQVIFKIPHQLSLFNVGYVGYHNPLALINIFVVLCPENKILATRFIPFAIFVHAKDFNDFEGFWKRCAPHIKDILRLIHDSEIGDFYQFQEERKKVFLITKEKSVIVLGRYTEPEMQELLQVRDYLRSKGYDAYLIKDLPELPMMSNEEKVRLWTISSRFCIMIDREPAGHIAEFQILKEQRTILALLRPKGKRSTYMIGDEHLVDYRYINLFEFENSPLEVLDLAINWAENLVKERVKQYGEYYPWRKQNV